MKNYIKVIGVLVAGLLLANCSSTTYNMKSEKGKVLNKVPAWYMNDFKVKKACGTTKFGKTNLKSVSLVSVLPCRLIYNWLLKKV